METNCKSFANYLTRKIYTTLFFKKFQIGDEIKSLTSVVFDWSDFNDSVDDDATIRLIEHEIEIITIALQRRLVRQYTIRQISPKR